MLTSLVRIGESVLQKLYLVAETDHLASSGMTRFGTYETSLYTRKPIRFCKGVRRDTLIPGSLTITLVFPGVLGSFFSALRIGQAAFGRPGLVYSLVVLFALHLIFFNCTLYNRITAPSNQLDQQGAFYRQM